MWTGHFLEPSRDTVEQRPEGMGPYVISFYVQWGSYLRKAYVIYYHPRRSGAGCVYLPGRGDAWRVVNLFTIIRGARDGKWSYANSAWEDLLKPIIARAEADQSERLRANQMGPA